MMSGKKTLIAAAAIVAVALNGCGTICNFAGGISHPDSEPRVYGGVQKDIAFIEEKSQGPSLGMTGEEVKFAWLAMLLVLADPPVSFVADTLTLPITVYVQNKRIAAAKSDEGNLKSLASPATGSVTLGEPRPNNLTGDRQSSEKP